MNLAIAMVEDEPEAADFPTPQMLVLTPALRAFLGQFDEDLRLFGSRRFAKALDQIALNEDGTILSADEWWALRHGIIDRLVTAKSQYKATDFLVIKPGSHSGLLSSWRKNLYPRSEADRLTKHILGATASEAARAAFLVQNFFAPEEFIGEFKLSDFML